jgi:hypothetical protein
VGERGHAIAPTLRWLRTNSSVDSGLEAAAVAARRHDPLGLR